MKLFFSVGEPSGDQHAAHLIEELRRRRPDIEFCGYGGPLMERAGCQLHFQLTLLAVMGFVRVVPLLWKFFKLVRDAKRCFRESPPDAVVLVDFPGFNWWIARKAKAAGIPVFYYLPPQLWAWCAYRVKRMRKFVDYIISALPFEKQWYAERGMHHVDFVGHPFFDEVADHPLDEEFLHDRRDGRVRNVGILPGSRNHEVTRNWPVMLRVMQDVAARHPDVRFRVACFKESQREFCRRLLQNGYEILPVELSLGKTPEIIELSECCLMVSGSVSLEVMARTTPAVVVYHAGFSTFALGWLLIVCKYISLPNLIAGREVMPEFPPRPRQHQDAELISQILNGWLSAPEKLDGVRSELAALRDQFGKTGATPRAAETILNRLQETTDVSKAA